MFDRLGLQHTPWVIRVYLMLILLFAAMVLLATFPQSKALWPLASEGLKTVLAALLGALSVAGGAHLRGAS